MFLKAERNDAEDEPPAKRRLSSAVVKVICVRKVIAFSLIDRRKWFSFLTLMGNFRSTVKMLVRMENCQLMAMEPRF